MTVTLIVGVRIIIPQQVFEGGVDCGTRERAQVRVVRGMGTWWVQRRNEWGMVSSVVGNWA